MCNSVLLFIYSWEWPCLSGYSADFYLWLARCVTRNSGRPSCGPAVITLISWKRLGHCLPSYNCGWVPHTVQPCCSTFTALLQHIYNCELVQLELWRLRRLRLILGNARRVRSSLLSALFSRRVVHTTPLGGYRHFRKWWRKADLVTSLRGYMLICLPYCWKTWQIQYFNFWHPFETIRFRPVI